MLNKRFLTALVVLPLLVLLIEIGGWFFFGAMCIFACIAIWEYVDMLRIKGHQPKFILAFGLMITIMVEILNIGLDIFFPTLTLLTFMTLAWQLYRSPSQTPLVDWALTLAGSLYIGLGMGHLLGLRLLPDGSVWVYLAVTCAWMNDTLAYFGGRFLGKNLFWPSWSPKKTWEGLLSGTLGSILGAAVVIYFVQLPLIHALIIGGLTAIVSPLGDLSISLMKRYTGVKDTSRLLPGHGGALDRLDSLMFVGIVVFYYIKWMIL